MADNNRPTIKKASLVLALACIIFATVATIMYKNHQIDLIGYSTPFIIGTVVTILTCAALQRMFCLLFAKGYLSFGCNISTKTEAVALRIKTDKPDELSRTDNTTSMVSVVAQESSYLEKYDARMEELERAKKERRTAIVRTIHDYTTYIMAEFFTKKELEMLHENIDALAYGQPELYKPIRSKLDNPIKSPAIRHFAWNIGERLDIPLIDRAKFIKEIFPHELGNATIEYLSKNLRDSVISKIKIDVPENGDYHFDCMKNFADGKISSC
ncbi:hypothetical protein [Paraprevotella xylaniphila]|jgi:putative protein involved in transposition|uniref:hypothetical protein n=1 Tax=Paraprevotella xylaniphila TaxID=454155 RepID=UPI00266DA68A|nr:hypothetical protein [Paraprevotella xylaniphila]